MSTQSTGMQGSTPGATSTGQYAEKMEQAAAGLGRLAETAQQTMDRVSQAASHAAARFGERSEELWELERRAADTARSYIREHPLATIGIAIALGLLISRLTSRR